LKFRGAVTDLKQDSNLKYYFGFFHITECSGGRITKIWPRLPKLS